MTYEQIALICNRSVSHVRFWFSRERNYRRPTPNDLHHLSLGTGGKIEYQYGFEEFFAITNRLSDVLGGSKIELFARELREGWTLGVRKLRKSVFYWTLIQLISAGVYLVWSSKI